MTKKIEETKQTEIESLSLENIDIDELDARLELVAAVPSWCCTQQNN